MEEEEEDGGKGDEEEEESGWKIEKGVEEEEGGGRWRKSKRMDSGVKDVNIGRNEKDKIILNSLEKTVIYHVI